MRYNEPLTEHIPSSQLMKNAGGDCDFEYDHNVYWPALTALAETRRKERKDRWEAAGKHIGENEVYLWGGEEKSVGGFGGAASEPETKEEGNGVEEEKLEAAEVTKAADELTPVVS